MIDASRVLRPLDEAEDAVQLLDDYETPAQLARAVGEIWRAVEQSLRLLLRADRGAPDELRLAALSPGELPTGRLLDALRRRELITLELAGTAHELERAAARAAKGEIRAADGDLARQVVNRLRAEAAVAPAGPEARGPTPVQEEPAADETPEAPERWSGARPFRIAAAVVSALILIAFVFALMRALDDQMEEATAAFAAGRLDEAEERFEAVLEDAPENVTAHLYVARIRRREADYRAAAEHLRAAARVDPDDPDVRRELGHLFMDLDRPRAAAGQYRRALEVEPENERSWIGLILALRAAGDPRAEELLRQAPPEVRAVLTDRE